jgi:hypothetical protein
VGYGDIVPVNKFEKALIVVIIVLGCSYFSWILSQLASRFRELNNKIDIDGKKEEVIEKMVKRYRLNRQLRASMLYFVRKNRTNLE